jgi:succinoglycan biosynthesis protein ExoO
MSSPTDVSVIIPTFNAEKFINRALSSVVAQTLKPKEILVIDDCSTDGTIHIVREAARASHLIKTFTTFSNSGPSVARNLGIEAASGTWIAVLDADDAFEPERLTTLISFALETGADLVADDLAYYDAGADCITGRGMSGDAEMTSHAITIRDFLANNLATGTGLDWGLLKPIIRKSSLKHNIRYNHNLRHGEDFRLIIDLLCSGAEFWLLRKPLYIYTQRQGALSGRASGMTRTTIAYGALKDATLALSRDIRFSQEPELVALLRLRAIGLGRLDDSHFISIAIHSGALWRLAARGIVDPPFFLLLLKQVFRAGLRRLFRRHVASQ